MAAIIRREQSGDEAAIGEILRVAFGREDEARLVAELRGLPTFNRALSLVAAVGDELGGHVLFTPVKVGEDSSGQVTRDETASAALAPLAVRPNWQRRGVGSQLVRAGLAACLTHGYRLAIVVGHPGYYPRFGFRPARELGLEVPFAVPDDVFMVCELSPGALEGARGMIEYPQPFCTL
jgi:putative acetyltransferase